MTLQERLTEAAQGTMHDSYVPLDKAIEIATAPDPILNCPMEPNDADAATVREYLQSLLDELVRYGEGFSGKRPFGNSGWEHEMPQAIVAAGLAKDEDDAGTKLLEAIRRL